MKTKQTQCRSWKKGKHWLYSAGVLAVLVGGSAGLPMILSHVTIHAQAAATMPTGFDQIGSIGSAPLYETTSVQWSNIQEGVNALAKDSNADYYVGSKSKDGKGQAVGWYDGQTKYSGTSLESLKSADPADLSQPNYNFVHKAIMSDADGFTDTDNFNFVSNPGEYVGIHNVGQAFDVKNDKYVPIGVKVTIDDAKYYDSNEATTPKDVFGDGYKLMVAARNDGRGNITLGYVVVMNGVAAVDHGGGGEGGGNGGSGTTYGGATTGIPDSVEATLTYVNEDTGEVLPNNSLSVMKVADIDAGQAANLQQVGVLGYIISNPSNIEAKNNVLTAKTNATVSQDASTLDANSFISVQTQNSFSLKFTDTLGNNNQGSIIESLFGTQSVTAPEPTGYLQLDKTTVQYGDDLPNNLYDFTDLKFQVLDKDKKVVETLSLDKNGKSAKSKGLPAGDYTLHEISSNWSATGQTERPDVKVTIKSGETTTVSGDQLANTAVQGQISITKKGVESGDAMWNENYTLAGNEFKITSLTDGKTYTLTTDAKGKAQTGKIPLGKYKVEETKASNGFVKTFKPVEVELTYKDKSTELVFDEATGTNQEVKGQNKIGKSDKETGKDQHGKAEMKTAKYALYYNDTSNGSSPHKVDQAVSWKDIPKAKLLEGEKVSEAVINGTTVNFGDQVVIDVDDTKLEAAVGNLAEGKYYWKEVDAGEGYVVDSAKHEFEISKKDDQTANIVTADTASKEQAIKAKISLQKLAETAGAASSGSGYNGVVFEFTPLEGTKADSVKVTTGINPTTDEDGYASTELVYGDWKMSEIKGIDGYDKIPDIYIHMSHDTKTDLITITASNNEDGSDPFSTRTFNATDNSDKTNPNDGDQTIAGNTNESSPFISLSKFILTNKNDTPKTPEEPSIDIEKANGKEAPKAGEGNYSDKVDNIGENDHDTEQTALVVKGGASTDISGLITNNGKEALTHLVFTDKTLVGKIQVGAIKVTYKGEELTTNNKGEFLLDGKLLVLQPGETLEINGLLPKLTPGELHEDEMEITGIGVSSNLSVGDKDDWFGKTPEPSIDIEKSNDDYAKAGNGNNTDKDNNAGKNDHDTVATAESTSDKKTPIFFHITNNGDEALTDLVFKDKTTDGKIDVNSLKFYLQSKKNKKKTTLSIDTKTGYFVDDKGATVTLEVGDEIFGEGSLDSLPAGELHGDDATITGTGVISGSNVGDHDKWYGKRTPQPAIDVEKTDSGVYDTGKGNDSDQANNVKNDHDTATTAANLKVGQTTEIDFNFTNVGNETLVNLKPVDETISGQVDVTKIAYTYKGKSLTLDQQGYFMLNGKRLELPVGDSIKGKGTLPSLKAGEVHGDKVTITGVGKFSKKTVKDHDNWYGKTPSATPTTPSAPTSKPNLTIVLPDTGTKVMAWLTGLGLAILASVGGFIWYKKNKNDDQ